MVSDPKALRHIFHTSGYDFAKQQGRREMTRMLVGRGLVWADGAYRYMICAHMHQITTPR